MTKYPKPICRPKNEKRWCVWYWNNFINIIWVFFFAKRINEFSYMKDVTKMSQKIWKVTRLWVFGCITRCASEFCTFVVVLVILVSIFFVDLLYVRYLRFLMIVLCKRRLFVWVICRHIWRIILICVICQVGSVFILWRPTRQFDFSSHVFAACLVRFISRVLGCKEIIQLHLIILNSINRFQKNLMYLTKTSFNN